MSLFILLYWILCHTTTQQSCIKKQPCFSFDTDKDELEGALSFSVRSTHGSSSLGSVARSINDDEDIDDFECESGISDALQKYRPVSIRV